jgi:hypothetical protein
VAENAEEVRRDAVGEPDLQQRRGSHQWCTLSHIQPRRRHAL